MSQSKPKDFQRTVELINKYILSSTQFMNRFAAACDAKLGQASRQLQRLESQVTLLERKLDSIDGDGAPAPKETAAASPPLAIENRPAGAPGLPPGVSAPNGPPPPPGMKAGGGKPPPLPPGVAAPRAIAAPPMANGKGPGGPPPPPGARQPPLPPGVSAAGGGGPQPLALMPPPMPNGAPPPGAPPPPPPPMAAAAGTATRNHPKLAGYFKMQDAGVPVVAIKQKMQSDGYNPDWFDNPDGPAPLPAISVSANGRTEYDSD